MAIRQLSPKYGVGQNVWVAEVRDDIQNTTCPDCLGTKHWPVTVPGGDTFDLECATCRYGYEVRGYLTTHVTIVIATSMTIGSVRTDTASEDRPIGYMMEQTGVGTGRVWDETDVFATEADVQPRLNVKRAEVQAGHDSHEAARIAGNKKRACKPDYKERRIRDLEKQLADVVR